MTGIAFEAAQPRRSLVPGSLRIAGVATGALVLGAIVGAILLALIATRFFDFHVLTVTSGSMAPAINSGDLIVTRPVAIGEIEEGDIILFQSGGDRIPTVHRVIGINEVELQLIDRATGTTEVSVDHRLLTMGDANPAPDSGEVTADRLLGEVWFEVPAAGAIAGRGIVLIFAVVLGVAIAAWASWEIAIRLRDRHTTV
ncbi:MAG: signal peptidase I [Dehalococcoidia bacterium]|nr:signal peptidase I [Dehalococcoidia bacterium]